MSRATSGIILTLLLTSTLTLAFNIRAVRSNPATITVPDDFPTIQEAINNANAGDTVLVDNGTYHEDIIINQQISLIGEEKECYSELGNSSTSRIMQVSSFAEKLYPNREDITSLDIVRRKRW